MKIKLLFLLACAIIAQTGFAAAAAESRPAKTPLAIADFERPQSIALWNGLPCERTDAHASTGKFGMRFTIPKWKPGENRWPAVYLAYNGGRGYPTRDWSRYDKIGFDAWVEGDKPAEMSFEFREKRGHNGPTGRFTVKPGRINHIQLPIPETEMKEAIDEIVLFMTQPDAAFTVTIDNLRLLPPERPQIADLDLVYPNYRQLVFPGAGDVEVAVAEHAEDYELRPEQLTLTLSLRAGEKQSSLKRTLVAGKARFKLPVAGLPLGPAVLSAAVSKTADGTALAEREWRLQLLAPKEVARLKVYIDRNNNTVVDGKPFFPLGWYDRPDERHLAEIADSPFNCILDYGTNHKPKDWMLRYLDTLHSRRLKLIYCLNDVYPTAKYFKNESWEGVRGNQAIADAVVAAYRDHPAILAWYLNDELPRSLLPELTDYYHRVRTADPNHPCFIVLCNMAELRLFPRTTDILGVDPYPIPASSVTTVSRWTDAARRAGHGRMPVWVVPQAFAWYQYNPAGSDRARKPTAAELKSGRAPNYEEERCMTYLALAHGAKGLIYYCYYDLRSPAAV